MQGSNGDIGIEIRLVDTVGEGEGGTNSKSSTEAYTLHAKLLRSCPTLCDPIDPTRLLHAWDSPGKNTGVGFHFLLQDPYIGVNK